jgi:hypothetical protein
LADYVGWKVQTGNLPDGVPHPSETLGYQILRWCSKYIVHPDGRKAGQPWEFTKEQKRFILWAYTLKPDEELTGGEEESPWLYPEVSLRRSKGWGKTPLLAALAIIEFIGPCRYAGRDENGMPIGIPVPLPLVQVAATSLDQTQQTRDMIRGMLGESDAEEAYGLEIGKEKIQFRDGRPGRIEPVASSSRGLEGHRPTFVRPPDVYRRGVGLSDNSLSVTKPITGFHPTAGQPSSRPSSGTLTRPWRMEVVSCRRPMLSTPTKTP